jgi:hypothetical protein
MRKITSSLNHDFIPAKKKHQCFEKRSLVPPLFYPPFLMNHQKICDNSQRTPSYNMTT